MHTVNRVALPLDGFRPGEVRAREKNEKRFFLLKNELSIDNVNVPR